MPSCGRGESAQRLSASPRRRGAPTGSRSSWTSTAQRLSASPRRRGRVQSGGSQRPSLLNAFRHHRVAEAAVSLVRLLSRCPCSTPFGITASPRHRRSQRGSRLQQLLNAFRHHRVAEGKLSRRAIDGRVCSTPFGITASPRKQRIERQAVEALLNAFRHHRVAEGCTGERRAASASCSTPFGITASPRGASAAITTDRSVCSTPFGITASPRIRRDRAGDRLDLVLNAFRHHRVAEASIA